MITMGSSTGSDHHPNSATGSSGQGIATRERGTGDDNSQRAIAIRISGLGRYFGPRLNLGEVTAENVWRNLRGIFGFGLDKSDAIRRGVVIAGQVLKDISLEIEKHSIVCLAGPSGSGKSVLLRILAGMTQPTEGRAELYGTVGRLLKAGENLDDDLSGLENIEKERTFRDVDMDSAQYAAGVIAFAGIEKFERVQVKRYSTGMAMRLSLALALQGNPDILLLDDVLGVGDIAFQQQFVDRLLELKAAGCTMVLALSDESLMLQLASRIITLEEGAVVGDGPPKQHSAGRDGLGSADVSWQVARDRAENDAAALRDIAVTLVDSGNGPELRITIEYLLKLAPQRCRPTINLHSGRTIVFRSLYPNFISVPTPQLMQFVVHLPVHLLSGGTYVVATTMVSMREQDIYSLKHNSAVTFEVKGRTAPEGTASLPLIAPALPWDIEILQEET